MGVKRDKDGAIADITKPLMGALQEFQGVVPLPASNPSQSIVDVSENMRAKLYSLFCKIGKFLSTNLKDFFFLLFLWILSVGICKKAQIPLGYEPEFTFSQP